MGKVSLYIPCFNSAKTIRSCLEAVFKQTFSLEEVVVVDDGSTDETVEVISGYPVRLLKHRINLGLSSARNTALRNMNTEFIASLDADCLPEENWLEHLMKRLDASDIAGAGGKLLEPEKSSLFNAWRAVHMQQHWEGWEDAQPPFLFGSNTVFRKEAIEKIGYYNETYRNNYEDVDICARLKKAGFRLTYEEKAVVRHSRVDGISSLMNTYWNWHFGYYQKEGYFDNQQRFIFKIKDNIGLANRYLEEDIASGRPQLVYLDFLLALQHSLRDFEYFIYKHDGKDFPSLGFSALTFWLSLVDLVFFYHFDYSREQPSTLIAEEGAFLQNFFALNLMVGKLIHNRFGNSAFLKRFQNDLFFSLYSKRDSHLLEKLSGLTESSSDWGQILIKKQPNVYVGFLENITIEFKKWLDGLAYQYPGIIEIIKNAQIDTAAAAYFTEGSNAENR